MRSVRSVLIGDAEEGVTIAARENERIERLRGWASCHHDHLFALGSPTLVGWKEAVNPARPLGTTQALLAEADGRPPTRRPDRTCVALLTSAPSDG